MFVESFYRVWDVIAFGVLGLLPVVLAVWYVQIIMRRNKVREALGSIDAHLKQRLDLIPNMLRMAQKFMTHERSLLEDITQLRTRVAELAQAPDPQTSGARLSIEDMISSKMGQLMVQVENYPDLKSDQTMVQAMQTFNEVEARIAASRRFFNSAVTALNNAVEIFPGSLIAKLAGVSAVPHFAAEEEARKAINADDFLTEPAR
ncbi:LemA family protein [Pseudahrensia aquimaris]|uniref:LemA family protein n=1 Tax=Pseudahrensia aquimaris TaxID=744461 RepID=A0ABW3FEP4_9HYPH